MNVASTTIAYHFVGRALRDGRPVPAIGAWLVHEGPVKMCESGLHASRDPFDALTYAPGDILCKVEVEDIRKEQTDKLVCTRRRIIAKADAGPMLRYFARMQALSVVHLWDAPDVVLDYLMTGDESLRGAAYDAAYAAYDAAYATAYATAHAAAHAASRAARAASRAARAASRAARAAHAARAASCVASCGASAFARAQLNALVDELDWETA